MNYIPALKSLTGAVLLACSQNTLAADFYRCGNSYQDTPCTGISAKNQTAKSNAKAINSDSLQPAKIDTDCRQRGDDAKKIMWARETGKTLNQQLESAKDDSKQALIKDVYNHRGSSLEVRNAIEQECMQQKDQDKLADRLIIEARKLRGNRNTGIESQAADKTLPDSTPDK